MEFCCWMKDIEDGLGHRIFQMTTVKYLSDQENHRYEIVDELKNLTDVL